MTICRMFVFILLLVFCTWTAESKDILVSHSDGKFFRPDYTFDPDAGAWLKFHPIPKTWYEAALRCFHEGAILASPLNEGISSALRSIMEAHGVTHAPILTGISDKYAVGEFQSIEGVPVTDMCLTWSSEPNLRCPLDVRNCIALNVNGSATSVCCSEQHAYVCYRQKGVDKLNNCGNVRQGYEYSSETGSCYRTSVEKLTWSEAFQACAIDGAHLTVINSEEEARVLMHLRDHNLSDDKTVLIGLLAWNNHRDWITVHGEPLDKSGYSKWAAGEPNNAGGNESCGSISRDVKIEDMDKGILNDMPCDSALSFICEIKSAPNETEQ